MSLTNEELKIARERFEEYDKMCDLYNNDPRFKIFVDKTCKQYNLHKDIALLHKTVQDVGEYYISEPDEEKAIKITKDYSCGCDVEDRSC